MHIVESHIFDNRVDLVIPATMDDQLVVGESSCVLRSLERRSPEGLKLLYDELYLWLCCTFQISSLW